VECASSTVTLSNSECLGPACSLITHVHGTNQPLNGIVELLSINDFSSLSYAMWRCRMMGNTDIVDLMLDGGASPRSTCGHGDNALDFAVINDDLLCVSVILDRLETPMSSLVYIKK
jgi:hypothetical protein